MNLQDILIPHFLFERVVDLFPENIAVEEQERNISYRKLNGNANRLARVLQKLGVTRDSIVVTISSVNIELITSMLAIFKAGGIYLPVDMGFSEKRLRQVFTQTFDGILLVSGDMEDSTRGLTDKLEIPFRRKIVLDGNTIKVIDDKHKLIECIDLDISPEYAAENSDMGVSPEDSSYIFYTSGSTGDGKAILGCNKSLYHYVNWVINEFDIKAEYRIAHISQLTFDASLKDIFMAIGTGATLCIPPISLRGNIIKLVEWLDGNRITIFQTVPSVFRLMLKNLPTVKESRYFFKSLRHVMLDGEVLYSKDVKSWRLLVGDHVELINLYGTTESTILNTFHRIKEVPENPSAVLHVGKPIDENSILIINENKLCPIGRIGDVYIRTPFLTRGYYKNQTLTAESFVQNPLVSSEEDIVYKTGDIGRYLKDRNIEIVGRKDQQVKINGIRIELSEIEQAVKGTDGVDEVVVKVYQKNDQHDLICYYTSTVVDEQSLRKSLQKVLNKNVIPSHFIKLDTFPLNINGKIDKKALPLPEDINASSIYEAPVNEIEEKLEVIWKEILGLSKVSRSVSFFAAGGHSLKAIQLVSKIYKEFGIDLSIANIFKNETIAALGNLINASTKVAYEPIKKVSEAEWYEITHAQKRLWLLSQIKEQSVAYNVANAYLLKGSLEIRVLEKCLTEIVNRHEVLRTTFVEIEGSPKQRINFPVTFDLKVVDLQSHRENEHKIIAVINEESEVAFDLREGPLVRAELLVIDQDEYIFVLTIHHIVIDAWSSEILLNEITRLYNSYKFGVENPLKPLPLQYKDYAAWQNNQLNDERIEEHRQYWLSRFDKRINLLDLPVDRSRSDAGTNRAGQVSKILNESLLNSLNLLSQTTGGSMFMTLLAIVKVLLYRYTGQRDIVIGCPATGRVHSDLEDQIGFYVNTLALYSDIDGERPFSKFLNEVKLITLEAYAHQVYPFDLLVEELERAGKLEGSTLFNVMMTLQHSRYENSHEEIDGLSVAPYNGIVKVSKFDLLFGFKEMGTGLFVNIEYNTDLFNEARILRMIGHLENIVRVLANNFDACINKIRYIGDEEEQDLLVNFNNAYAPYPAENTIAELFEIQAAKTPSAVAIMHEDNTVTYRELNERSNQLAHYLRENYFLKPNDLVGIMADRSDDLIIAILGVLKAGGAYMPVDPGYPQAHVRYMLEDSTLKVLLIDRKEHAVTDNNRCVVLEEIAYKLRNQSSKNPEKINKAEDLVYVIYTSGSTGTPKGVMIKSHAFVNLLQWYGELLGDHAKGKNLLIAPISFDLAQKNLFAPLLNGGTVCMLRDTSNYYTIQEFIEKNEIAVINCAPAAFYPLLEIGDETDFKSLASIRQIALGGEPVRIDKLLSWKRSIHYKAEIYNTYGPTECTDVVSYYKLDETDFINKIYPPIGKPVQNNTLYILDKNRSIVPIGCIGEIFIGGVGIAKGYLNHPDLEFEKFIENPFDKTSRLYRTGDLGRWTECGNIEFLGRLDNQVKIRGFRIELGEIEQILNKQEGIEQGVVAVKEGVDQERHLVVYYTSRIELSIEKLKNKLAQYLPAHMVPSYYCKLETIPVMPSGKVNHKALPKPDEFTQTGNDAYVAPRNRIETTLVSIWEGILGTRKIGINDNFFAIGGHSLKAMQAVGRIYKTLDYKLELKNFFTHSTIAALAELITQTEQKRYEEIYRIDEQEYYEVSHAQKRLWVLHQFNEGKSAYNIPEVYVLEGTVNRSVLEKSFTTVVSRHESLRTTFITVKGEPKQKIHKEEAYPFCVEYIDLRNESRPDEQAGNISEAEAATLFDLEHGPLFKVKLLQLEEDRYMLLLTMHHIISDGWSMEVMIRELLVLYNVYCLGQSNPFSQLPIQYKDYAHWQNQQLAGGQLNTHRLYWLEKFKGELPVLELPTDYLRPSVKTYHGDRIAFVLSPELSAGIKRIGQQEETSLFMTVLAVIKSLLYRYTGQQDIIVGSPVSGREHFSLEDQIGFYINMLAIRTSINGGESFRALLHLVKDGLLQGYSHQYYPFDLLVEELNLARDTSRNPLYDVGFTWYDSITPEEDLPDALGFSAKGQGVSLNVSKADLWFHGGWSGDKLVMSLEYDTALFARQRIERLIDHFQLLAKAIVEDHLTVPLNRLQYMSLVERNEVLLEFNQTARWYPRQKTIQSLFETQAKQSPEAIAVVFEGESLTYRELNERSNQLAHYLRKQHKIVADDFVGLMVHRSIDMIVAILGILKSGGAYVPLDPGYPKERKAHILADASIKVLLTDSSFMFDVLEYYRGELFALDIELSGLMLPKTNPRKINKSEDLAYLMYTSGSTGVPKGVMVEHRSVVRLVKETNYTQINPGKRILQLSNYAFDGSVYDIFGALLNGATLYCISKDDVLNNDRLLAFINNNGINIMFITTALFNNIVELNQECVRHFDKIYFGGEEASLEHIRKALACRKYEDSIVHVYGPTEGTTFSTYHTIKNIPDRSLSVPIGAPISNTTIYIVDHNFELVPVGIQGEIYLGGEGLARGYWNSDDQTKAKFIDNPFNTEAGKLYKTGDMGRWTPEGAVEFLGRRDNQVKIRGHRIELGEVENTLIKHPDLGRVFVTTKPDVLGGKELIAYYTSDASIEADQLRVYASSVLPSYMIPSYFIRLESFPLNMNGKVDQRALPLPEGSWHSQSYVHPRNETEEKLCAIWQEVLGREKISVIDNFFTIGGDSIKAIRLVTIINKTLGSQTEVKDIFINENIDALASYILAQGSLKKDHAVLTQAVQHIDQLKNSILSDGSSIHLIPDDLEDLYPMSDIQKGMIFHNLLDGASGIYIDQLYYQIEDPSFDFDLFRKSFALLTEKHCMLRTSFHISDFGKPVQIVHRAASLLEHISYEDLTHLPQQAQQSHIEEFLRGYHTSGFQLNLPGLWKINVVQLSENEYGIVWILHHAIMDGWSNASLMTELSNVYTQLKKDSTYKPHLIKAAYKDYIIDQYIHKQSLAIRDYWRTILHEFERTSLPLNKVVSSLGYQSKEFAVHSLTIDAALSKALESVSNKMSLNIKHLYLAAFVCLVRATTNTRDVTIGLVGHARPEIEDADKIVGCFLNTVPFRTTLASGATCREVINAINNACIALKGNDKLPLQEIVEMMGAKSDAGNALFDMIFNYIDFHITTRASEEIKVKHGSIKESTNTNTYFDFNVGKYGESIIVSINSPKDIYAEGEIHRILEYYRNILKCFAYEIDGVISYKKILPEEEKFHVLEAFNATSSAYPGSSTIHELFEAQVRKTPEAIAVVFNDKRLTYHTLNENANRLAHCLREKFNIKKDDLIGLMMHRSELMAVALLGILKSGGAYVPIDPEYPAERIDYLLNDSNVNVIITSVELLPFTRGKSALVLDSEETLSSYPSQNPVSTNSATGLAYLIYTSGSTGTPKGVMIEHRSVVRLVKNTNYIAINENARLLQTGALSFDATTFEVWGMLLNGGELHLLSQDALLDIQRLKNKINESAIEMMWFTASWFNKLVDSDITVFGKLKFVLVGGEKLSVAHINKVLKNYPGIQLINGYGPTENTTFSVCHRIDKAYIADIPLGKPVSNSTAYVLDENLEPLGVGVIGEIYLGGSGLARGYWQEDELTRKKFVNNPFKDGERLYRSGDLGRWNENGTLDYVGRIDTQVKIRGYRIELSEIEHVMLKVQGVEKVLVTVAENQLTDKLLVGYYTGADSIETALLKAYVSERLPDYMVPSYFISLKEFPLTGNGKIDYKALPSPGQYIEQAMYVAPGNLLERKLCTIWQEVLGLEKIGIKDNFFENGGHSLKAMQVMSRIHKELGYKLELKNIFTHPTIEELSRELVKSEQQRYEDIVPVAEQEYYEVSHAQKRIWLLSQFEEGRLAYNIPTAYELEGSIDRSALEKSFASLINRHESLRTTFHALEGELKQKISAADKYPVVVSYVDLRGAAQGEAQAQGLLEGEALFCFELEAGPLWRVKLIQLESERYILLFTVHHIISDGWSQEVLVRDLLKLYNSYIQGKENPLSSLLIQYKDYASWQHSQLSGSALKSHQQYWVEQFSGELPVLDLPGDYSRPVVKTYHGDRITLMLREELSKGLKELSQKHGGSLFMTLLGCVNLLLYRYTGQEDIIIGTPVAGRQHLSLEDQVGLYLNTLALRTQFSGSESFNALMDKVKEVSFGGFSHEVYPFDKLVEELPLDRDTSRTPLFDVMVILQNNEFQGEPAAMEGMQIKMLGNDVSMSKFDITFGFKEMGDQLALVLEYNSDIYKRSRMDRMAQHFEGIVSSVLLDSDRPLKLLSYMQEEEKDQVLNAFNDTGMDYEREKTLQELFENQVEQTPSSWAVSFEGITLTYEELNERSNRLAHYLREHHGVGRDEVVSLLLDRSEWTMVAILGVLKSGGCYLPIDIDTPLSRLGYQLHDGGADVLIVKERSDVEEALRSKYKIISLTEDWDQITQRSSANPVVVNNSSDLAYLLYTSGSTGKPKGVEVMHRSVVNFMTSMSKCPGIREDDVWLSVSNYTFDISILEMLIPILHGAHVVIASREELEDLSLLQRKLQSSGATIMQATPTLWSLLIESGWQGDKGLKVLSGGEKLSRELGKQLKELTGEVWNMYGPTETTIWSTVKQIRVEEDLESIGSPIGNTQVYVLDTNREILPIGVRGKIYIGGEGLSRGYRREEALTAKRFIAYGEERIYDTGDMGRWLEDGSLEYLGREDAQVKLRGHRIELGEIENVLLRHEAIDHAAVLLEKDTLIAYVSGSVSVEMATIQGFLSSHLPSYMLPSGYVWVAKFPMTKSGKTDRKALSKLSHEGMLGTSYVGARTLTEERIVKIWQEVLSQEKIGIKDNFFALGGHSIKAMQVMSRIHKELGYKLELKNIFTHPTIEELSRELVKFDQQRYEDIVPVAEQEYYEVSHAQKRLWILNQYSENKASYNIPLAYEIEGIMKPAAFEKAFKTLIARHDILRTTFHEIKGVLKQRVNSVDQINFALGYFDLKDEPAAVAIAQRMANEEARIIFDLSGGPLINARLLRLKDQHFIIILNMHHIISDGWSMKILMDEVLFLYDLYNNDQENSLPPLRIQYKDYTVWLRKQLAGEQGNKHRLYWLDKFSNEIPVLELPTDYSRPSVKTYSGRVVHSRIDSELTKKVKKLCVEQESSLFMALLAFVKVLLNAYSDHEDIVVGSPIAGRQHPDLENQIGLYINTLALRTQFSSEESFTAVLQKVKETTLGAFEHQVYPFDLLVQDLNYEMDFSRSPIFDVMVILQNAEVSKHTNKSIKEFSAKEFEISLANSKYDLLFAFAEAGDELIMTIEYSTDLFNIETIKEIKENFVHIVTTVVSDHDIRVADIELVNSPEKEKESSDFLLMINSKS